MIERINGLYTVMCDVCGEESDWRFMTFNEAVDCKRTEGWTKQMRNGEWEDVCPECQEE